MPEVLGEKAVDEVSAGEVERFGRDIWVRQKIAPQKEGGWALLGDRPKELLVAIDVSMEIG